MKLLHRTNLIGLIKNVGSAEMGLVHNIELLPTAEAFKPLFDFLIDQECNHQEPPFSEEILEGWSVEDEAGVDRPIFTPAIDNNYTTIEFLW
jgi:hypothetical protein